MGICTSTGVIRDFAGPYFVSVSNQCCNVTGCWHRVRDVIQTSTDMLDTAVVKNREGNYLFYSAIFAPYSNLEQLHFTVKLYFASKVC